MSVDWLLERMRESGQRPAIVWRDQTLSHAELLERVSFWRNVLAKESVPRGAVVALQGDYSPNSCALLLALIDCGAIVVPLTDASRSQHDKFLQIAETDFVVSLDAADQWRLVRRDGTPTHPLVRRLIEAGKSGLVLFSSGSTGHSKAALHDFSALLEKFRVRRHQMCTLTFLLLDHIGGINTLLYTLSNAGTVVSVQSRDPEVVCASIARHRVQMLPTSPTFLNLLLMSEAYRRHDLGSLELITYGTEVMPEGTLARLQAAFPHVRLLQTYGLSELGILRSKSRASDSLWVRVGGEGVETKVVDNTLRIRTPSAMLGYLNAPSPFDEDGWMNTEDIVDVDGEYIRFLGRRTEIINVGGQKAYPAEIENVLLQIQNVRDATVYGESNPITGRIVAARINLDAPEPLAEVRRRVRAFCLQRLPAYKVPARIEVTTENQYSERFKKLRGAAVATGTGTPRE